jgi:hypothetical protein
MRRDRVPDAGFVTLGIGSFVILYLLMEFIARV